MPVKSGKKVEENVVIMRIVSLFLPVPQFYDGFYGNKMLLLNLTPIPTLTLILTLPWTKNSKPNDTPHLNSLPSNRLLPEQLLL